MVRVKTISESGNGLAPPWGEKVWADCVHPDPFGHSMQSYWAVNYIFSDLKKIPRTDGLLLSLHIMMSQPISACSSWWAWGSESASRLLWRTSKVWWTTDILKNTLCYPGQRCESGKLQVWTQVSNGILHNGEAASIESEVRERVLLETTSFLLGMLGTPYWLRYSS